jgi:hypothetical protein
VDLAFSAWLVIAVAIAFANLPFLSEKAFGVLPLGAQGARTKHVVIRLLELFVLYFVVGALAYALESRIGNAFAQTWEFYAITGCMFVVLAFPGFVYRYLRRRRS